MSRKRWLSLSHHLVLAVVLVGLLTAFIPSSMVKADTVVNFPDPNLEAAVRQRLGKPSGDIYQSDFTYIRVLEQTDFERRGIVDLAGLEYWTPLEDANLGYNKIVDLSPLASLANLVILSVYQNRIVDLSPLASCPQLRDVEADDNQITTLAPIASLEYLNVSGNRISDLSPLAGLPNLEDLNAANNQIGDLSPLTGLPKLQRLGVPNNQIVDLSPLASCPNLVGVGLANNQITTLVPIAGLGAIGVQNNRISDLSPLASSPNLEQIWAANNQISDLSALQGLTGLANLDLSGNQISDIEPLVNNSGIGSGDKLDLRSNPLNSESVDTWIPELIARGVDVLWDQNTITGYVEDGFTHKIGGVAVTLLDVTSGNQTTQEVTITDDAGEYSFSGIDAGDYQIEVALECHKKVGDTAIFSVNYDTTGPAVSAQTPSFSFTSGELERDITFADADLVPTAGIPQDRLDDLAGMYYHTKQVIDFELKELGFTPDLNLPIEVHGYVTDNPSNSWDESQTCYYSDGQVYIGTGDSDYDDDDRPVNREWHEMFHELTDDAVGFPADHTGDENHDGYYNHCTGDSWVEGWANFWACALKRSLGADDWYCIWEDTSLEVNWQVWDFDDELSREEFAAASLLVDLIDPASPLDMDYISLSIGQLWAIIGSQPLANMYEVHIALTAANIGQSDTNANGQPDLDDLFIAHGFFADGGDPGNRVYDAGEEVGWGGKPGRKTTIRVPNAYLRAIVTDSKGNPIGSGTLAVNVVFDSPLDIYNYSYEVELGSSDSLVYFEVAPDRYDPSVQMMVRDGSGNLSDEFVLSNSAYWEKVNGSTTGYAAEHTFVLGGEAVPSKSSGGVPVWIWPIVGLAAVALGAGGFFLLRRRAKTG